MSRSNIPFATFSIAVLLACHDANSQDVLTKDLLPNTKHKIISKYISDLANIQIAKECFAANALILLAYNATIEDRYHIKEADLIDKLQIDVKSLSNSDNLARVVDQRLQSKKLSNLKCDPQDPNAIARENRFLMYLIDLSSEYDQRIMGTW